MNTAHLRDYRSRPAIERFEEKHQPEPNSGCWLWIAGQTKTGYGSFTGKGNPSGKAHRFSFQHYTGIDPAGFDICHKCDVPICVNPDHLFLGTRKENMVDAKNKGRVRHGSRHQWSKLTEADVAIIKAELASGALGVGSRLCERFRISPMAVSDIRRNRTWTSVPWPKAPSRQTRRKFTPDIMREIKRRLATDESLTSISKDYPISASRLCEIRKGKSWKDI